MLQDDEESRSLLSAGDNLVVDAHPDATAIVYELVPCLRMPLNSAMVRTKYQRRAGASRWRKL